MLPHHRITAAAISTSHRGALSTRHVSAVIRLIGDAPMPHLRRLRMQRATDLMRDGMTAAEAVIQVG